MKSFISENDISRVLNLRGNNSDSRVRLLMNLLSVNKLNSLYNEISNKEGIYFIDAVIDKLQLSFSVHGNIEKILPEAGPFIIISNHPLGGIDGLLLLKTVLRYRPDFKIQGNFMLHNMEPLREYIIPVNPFEKLKREISSFKGLRDALEHVSSGNAIGIFPAGEVSSIQGRSFRIEDRKWQTSSIRFIRSLNAPVIPVYFRSRNSYSFYVAGIFHPLIRTALIPSEIIKSRKRQISIEFGRMINSETINSFNMINDLSKYLRTITYSINDTKAGSKNSIQRPVFRFQSVNPVADPIPDILLQNDIDNLSSEFKLLEKKEFTVYCCKVNMIPNVMKEIARLREITFREAGEGTNKSLDMDKYDSYYYQLFMWDKDRKRIAGVYRIGKGSEITDRFGTSGFYTNSLFRMKDSLIDILSQSVELGRSFIVKEYQKQHFTLLFLWKGIFTFIRNNADCRYIIGPVSISNEYSLREKSLMVQFIYRYYFNKNLADHFKPVSPFRIPKNIYRKNELLLDVIPGNINALESYMNQSHEGFSLPVLLKKYLGMNGRIVSFNVDPGFNNCLDAMMIANIDDLPYEMKVKLTYDFTIPTDNLQSAVSHHSMKQAHT